MSDKNTINWRPLESNPEVLNKFIQELGVPNMFGFCDIFGLDPELLAMVPPGVQAVIFLFPVSEKYEKFRVEETERLKKEGQKISSKVYFMRQTIANACGTIAVVHSLCNNIESLAIGDSPIKRLFDATTNLSSDERGKYLESCKDIAKSHETTAQEGQTAPLEADADVDLHFVALVNVDGDLYELDGRKPFPINHGKCTDLLLDSARIAREFMDRDPDNLNFTLLGLTMLD
ncbi:ubiquitin carboxyl-terminal esterase L3 [Paraphysoderma sedebokerense]|nr:ubiquitin carboxyl-terminal esterase L3 [Paraphysoderma sedebokerense]